MHHLIRALATAVALHAGVVLAGQPVDINTASADALAEAISGVGATTARAIVAHREVHGPFGSVDDLMQVRGIGAQTIERSRENLTVGEPGR